MMEAHHSAGPHCEQLDHLWRLEQMHHVLPLVFEHLPAGMLSTTIAQLSTELRSWADAQKHSQQQERQTAKRYPYVPLWYAQAHWRNWASWQRSKAVRGAAFHGQLDLLHWVQHEHKQQPYEWSSFVTQAAAAGTLMCVGARCVQDDDGVACKLKGFA